MKKLYRAIAMELGLVLGGASVLDLKREEGQTLAEYGLILALIAIIVVTAVAFFGGHLKNTFSLISTKL
jgi:pilus assembly protein Flp/PilA